MSKAAKKNNFQAEVEADLAANPLPEHEEVQTTLPVAVSPIPTPIKSAEPEENKAPDPEVERGMKLISAFTDDQLAEIMARMEQKRLGETRAKLEKAEKAHLTAIAEMAARLNQHPSKVAREFIEIHFPEAVESIRAIAMASVPAKKKAAKKASATPSDGSAKRGRPAADLSAEIEMLVKAIHDNTSDQGNEKPNGKVLTSMLVWEPAFFTKVRDAAFEAGKILKHGQKRGMTYSLPS